MSSPAVACKQMEARASGIKAGLKQEESMSNLKYAIVEEEMITSTVDSVTDEKHPKPFVVSHGRKQSGDALTRRVESALDIDFANGSMPA